MKPIKEKLMKSGLIKHLVENSELTREQVVIALDALSETLVACLDPKGIGEFTLPGLLKVQRRQRPAIKKGTLVRNPATGETYPHAGRPVSWRVKLRPLSRLKAAAEG